MRTHGILIRWNDERDFGFVEAAGAGTEIFVHVSAFPRDGVRPLVGELVSFEVEERKDGKRQAVSVMRPGTARRGYRPAAKSYGKPVQNLSASVAGALLLGAIFAYVYISQRHTSTPVPNQTTMLISRARAPDPLFRCDGRTTCSKMRSCAEAKYFLDHCPGTTMDGNDDGIPCQSQWCSVTRTNWP